MYKDLIVPGRNVENSSLLTAAGYPVSFPTTQYKENAVMRATNWAALQSSKRILVSRYRLDKYREETKIFKYHFPTP